MEGTCALIKWAPEYAIIVQIPSIQRKKIRQSFESKKIRERRDFITIIFKGEEDRMVKY